jgi:Uma2 family endonuclease
MDFEPEMRTHVDTPMDMLQEITLPETKPAMEWVNGRAVQKVSPTRKHGRLQMSFSHCLDEWAAGRGEVATEWRFRLTPAGERTRPLVPDVAYISYERLDPLTPAEREAPPVAPDIVVEILSPDDARRDVDAKRVVYLSCGVQLVLIVDPEERSVEVFVRDGSHGTIGAVDAYVPPCFPDLVLPLRAMFDRLDYGR